MKNVHNPVDTALRDATLSEMEFTVSRADTGWRVQAAKGRRTVATVEDLPSMRVAADVRAALRSAYAVGAIDGLEQAGAQMRSLTECRSLLDGESVQNAPGHGVLHASPVSNTAECSAAQSGTGSECDRATATCRLGHTVRCPADVLAPVFNTPPPTPGQGN